MEEILCTKCWTCCSIELNGDGKHGRSVEGKKIMKVLTNIIMKLDFNQRAMGKFYRAKSREVCFRNATLVSIWKINQK